MYDSVARRSNGRVVYNEAFGVVASFRWAVEAIHLATMEEKLQVYIWFWFPQTPEQTWRGTVWKVPLTTNIYSSGFAPHPLCFHSSCSSNITVAYVSTSALPYLSKQGTQRHVLSWPTLRVGTMLALCVHLSLISLQFDVFMHLAEAVMANMNT